jgi:hypothetical protein
VKSFIKIRSTNWRYNNQVLNSIGTVCKTIHIGHQIVVVVVVVVVVVSNRLYTQLACFRHWTIIKERRSLSVPQSRSQSPSCS